jgi:hypothetical protein
MAGGVMLCVLVFAAAPQDLQQREITKRLRSSEVGMRGLTLALLNPAMF